MLLAALALILLWHARQYYPFLSDDALISLRYAKRLINGQGLTWTDGIRVEGYSNFLWVVLNASLGLAGVDLVVAARILGVLGMLAAAAAVLAPGSRSRRAGVAPVLAAAFFVLSAPIAIWAIGGLEQPLIAGLLAWVVALFPAVAATSEPPRGRVITISTLLGLLAITRPDGPIFAAAAVAALIVVRRWRRSTAIAALKIAAAPALLYAGQEIFRLAYYGAWLPNTALVKIGLSSVRAAEGLAYVRDGFRSLLPLSALAAVMPLVVLLADRDADRRARAWLIILTATGWTGYVAVIGGDIFPGFRHLVPLVVLLAFALRDGLAFIGERLAGRRWMPAAIAAILVMSLGFLGATQPKVKANRRAVLERWEWDGKVVGTMLAQAFGKEQPLLAVEPGGCIPYWSNLPSIDMLGLNDYVIPRHPPPDLGRGWIGHELGDGAYVLGREPDLVLFCGPEGGERACFRSGIQMERLKDFREEFTPVRLRAREPRDLTTIIWVRRGSPRIGIRQSGGTIVVPAYLLESDAPNGAYLGAAGRLVIKVSSTAPAELRGLRLPAEPRRVTVEPAHPALRAEAVRDAAGTYTIRLMSGSPDGLEVERVLIDVSGPAT